jgi:hypothetical protein
MDGSPADVALQDARRSEGGPVADAASPADAAAEDVVIDPGRCGTPVRECLCGCGADGVCQQNCVQSSDATCQDCLYEALSRCCPMESAAFEQCIVDSGCETDACILDRCGAQWDALQACARRREREPACLAETRRCLGADYPSIRCVSGG